MYSAKDLIFVFPLFQPKGGKARSTRRSIRSSFVGLALAYLIIGITH